jgi:hypothetical protein
MIGTLSGQAQKQIPIIWSRLGGRVATEPEKLPDRVLRTTMNLKTIGCCV